MGGQAGTTAKPLKSGKLSAAGTEFPTFQQGGLRPSLDPLMDALKPSISTVTTNRPAMRLPVNNCELLEKWETKHCELRTPEKLSFPLSNKGGAAPP